jgi:AcrR family transcriptional regulator
MKKQGVDTMAETKQDRRVRRTQKLLKDSLISLMQEKEFKNISVKDITERADLNRGTFYLHYTDIYQLLKEIEDEILSDFQSMINDYHLDGNEHSLLKIFTPIVHYVVDNRPVCKIMFENNASSDFMHRFHQLIYDNAYQPVQMIFSFNKREYYDIFFEYATYGIIGLIKKWLNTPDRTMGPDEMARLIDLTVMGTGQGLLNAAEKL